MDTSIRNLMGFKTKLKQASFLWLEGFREASCLHRVIIYCLRSRELAIRTGQCFLLNGFIFLGSIFVLRSVAIPTLQWVLPDGRPQINSQESCWGIFRFYSFLRLGLIQLFYVYVTGFIPYIGKVLNFMLLSWMYAYYCFEYKWNYSGLSLDKRLDFFESNWPFFAGFGSSCVLAVFFYSPLVSYGVMAILYPLFVLTASGSEADKVIASQRKKWRGAGLGRIPIFVSTDYLSMKVLSLFPLERLQQQMQEQKAL